MRNVSPGMGGVIIGGVVTVFESLKSLLCFFILYELIYLFQ
jgi:hypothetical protein